jgi:hypothetical protein
MYALFLGGTGLLWFFERVRPAGAGVQAGGSR